MSGVPMTSRSLLAAFTLCGGLAWGVGVSAQSSRCADCHLTRPDLPGEAHALEWDRSPHGRNNVGCEKCHGGDPTTVEAFLAHRDVVSPADPRSPLSRRNIPTTCGACHIGPFVAFQDSRHFALLEMGDTRVPTCLTCHGTTDGRVLSARALESQCNACHGPGQRAARPGRASEARELYEGLTVVREQIKLAGNLIRRVSDPARRAELLDAQQQAEVPLTRAINAGHRFVYDDMETYRALAQQRAEALLARLANPAER
jgi:hypothetical protein